MGEEYYNRSLAVYVVHIIFAFVLLAVMIIMVLTLCNVPGCIDPKALYIKTHFIWGLIGITIALVSSIMDTLLMVKILDEE